MIQGGSFLSTGFAKSITLPGSADYFLTKNITQMGLQQATGRGFQFEWFSDNTPVDAALEWKKQNASDVVEVVSVSSGGFTYVPGTPPQGPAIAGTTITNANPAIASAPNSFSDGDRVRIYNVTGMQQISAMAFTVSSANALNFTLLGLDASGFLAGATAFTVRKIPQFENVLPEYLFITGISQASQAVLTVSTLHDYVAGMKIRIDIPYSYGMQEMNGLTGTIVAVGAYTITVDINSSGFTPFAFPASAVSAAIPRFATLAPSGQKAYYDTVTATQYGYNLTEAPFRSVYGSPYMYLAAGAQSPAGSAGDLIEYQAFRYE